MKNGYIGRLLNRPSAHEAVLAWQTGMAGPKGREDAYRCDRDRLAVT